MHVTSTTSYRTPERSGIRVSALGLGCAAIGGQFHSAEGASLARVDVDDNMSIRAMQFGPLAPEQMMEIEMLLKRQ